MTDGVQNMHHGGLFSLNTQTTFFYFKQPFLRLATEHALFQLYVLAHKVCMGAAPLGASDDQVD
ncbi:hypothetical protein D3C84_1246890 [compost metagenome]